METTETAQITEKRGTDYKTIRDVFPCVYEFVKTRDSGKEYTYWMVDARSKKYGLKERKTFVTKKAALDRAKEIADSVTKFGAQPIIEPEVKIRADKYQTLVDRLSVYGRTPEDAATHYLEFLAQEALRGIKPTVTELVDQYEKYKLLEKRDEQYESAIKLHCKYIRQTWGKLRIDELRKNDIDVRLTKDKPHKGTRKHYLTHLKMFLRWCIHEDKGYLTTNPAEGIKCKPDSFAKEHFTADEIKNLFLLVKEIHPELIGYYAVLTFIGLRPSEGARVTWKHINFETGQLRVIDESKTGERYCKLEPVALAWLKEHHARCSNGEKPFIPEKSLSPLKKNMGYPLFNNEREVREAYKEKYGKWASDVLRHTFATHFVRLIEDEPKASFYMGNTVAVIKKHYAKRIPKPELDAFWSLKPDRL